MEIKKFENQLIAFDFESELWKDIPGYVGFYKISNLSKVRSVSRLVYCKNGNKRISKSKQLKPKISTSGYYCVNLSKNGKCRMFDIHRLMGIVFLGLDDKFLVINHKDFNKLNNNISNLEIVTTRKNVSLSFLNKPKTSKYTGVYFNKKAGKYRANIKINGKNKHLGFFNNEKIASIAYQIELSKIK